MTDVPWSDGTWTRRPALTQLAGSSMMVQPLAETDFWRPSEDQPSHEDGHALLAPLRDGDVMQVFVADFDFAAEFHQAGLYCWSPDRWAKAGVDVIDGAPALMSVVSAPWSDSAIVSYAGVTQYVVRASLRSGLLALRVGVVDDPSEPVSWITQRTVGWSPATVHCGPFVCAPDPLTQLRVTFDRWSMPEPDDLLDPIGPS